MPETSSHVVRQVVDHNLREIRRVHDVDQGVLSTHTPGLRMQSLGVTLYGSGFRAQR